MIYFILVWLTCQTPAAGGLIVCECVSVCVCVSEDMSPYCSAHDEWLIMKLCMYVGYHDANMVSNIGGDPVTQLNFKKFYIIMYAVLRTRHSIAVTRSQYLRRLLRNNAQTAAVWKAIPAKAQPYFFLPSAGRCIRNI